MNIHTPKIKTKKISLKLKMIPKIIKIIHLHLMKKVLKRKRKEKIKEIKRRVEKKIDENSNHNHEDSEEDNHHEVKDKEETNNSKENTVM